MAAPVGSIFEVVFKTVVNDQVCLNVLHYVVTEESSTTGIAAETIQLATAVMGADALGPDFLACLAQNAILQEVSAQCIRDSLGTRYARQVLDVGTPGDMAFDCTAQNVSCVIVKRTSFAGRWAVGTFHIPGVPANAYEDGKLSDVAYKAAAAVLAAEILQTVTTPSGGEYTPVIYHPDGLHGGSTPLQDAERMDELRVMRRRTVGRGI